MSAWIEINLLEDDIWHRVVALLVSAWIEMLIWVSGKRLLLVALLVSAWIEMLNGMTFIASSRRRTPCECVD